MEAARDLVSSIIEDRPATLGDDVYDDVVMTLVITVCGLPIVSPRICGRLLGSGSYGVVYLGENGEAIKNVQQDTCVIEMRALAFVRDCPHFIHCYGAYFGGGDEYNLVLEYCPTDLSKVEVSSRQLRTWMKSLCEGLAWFHESGWVHGDIKPENILVRSDGTVCFCDLGGAADSRVSVSTSYTRSYVDYDTLLMDNGVDVVSLTPACDVWSLGMSWLERDRMVKIEMAIDAIPRFVSTLTLTQPHAGMMTLYAVDRLTARQALNLF